ncbi:MAG: ice-binding family protein [Polyangia bacterium]
MNDLGAADLAGSDLRQHDLGAADLSGVDLSGVDLANADFANADLANADFANADFANADLATGLAPTVVAVTPRNLATGVPTFRLLTATFDRPMDLTSLMTAFQLEVQGTTTLLGGTVTYDAGTKTATFSPMSPLVVGTTYTATITTAAKDTSGTHLAASFVWKFSTELAACGTAPIVLGAGASFGAFAGTTITSSGPTVVNGDIGVSPGTAIVGFGPSSGVAGPGIVNGSQRVPPDPLAGTARANIDTAATDAATRSLCPILIADGELGGKTLTPGLYRSGMSFFTITSLDLTLDAKGDPDAVFLFQTSSSTLVVADMRAVVLAGGAKAANVFWSVGTGATIGTTAKVQGTILAGTAISLNTGAVIIGRALAGTAVTMLSNTITVP